MPEINVNDLTFGIEIECYLPREVLVSGRIVPGGYHNGVQISELPEGWNAQRDGSLSARCNDRSVGIEIVSPATVRKTCGFHVHVGFDRRNREAMDRLVHLTSHFEKALYASTGTKAREQGHYCRPIQTSDAHRNGHYNAACRYHLLNTTSIKPTVEFRCFAGTINFTKIVGHVRQCLAIVEKSLELKRLPSWIAHKPVPTSPLARKGEGMTALTQFFYGMGWTRGQSKKIYGNLEAEMAPSIDDVKSELRRLAKKYDQAQAWECGGGRARPV